jgi:quercetin dioxygenase-like cupin family protein
MTQHLTAWDAVDAEEAPGGLTKRRLDLPGMSLVAVSVPAGTVAPRHSHPQDQFVQVISGTGTLTTERGAGPFAAGSVFVFPAGTWHAARFDTDTVLVETNLAAS